MDCSGGKKTRWQRNSCPDILASIEDHVVQGTKTSWWRKPFWPCSGERTKGKKTPQHLKLCDYKSSSSPNNNQWGTRTKQKRNLDSKSSQMLLIHLLHITWQQLHQQWRLELVSGRNSWRDLASSSAEDDRQMPGAAWAPLPLAAAERWWGAEWPYGAGAILFCPLWCHSWPS